MSNMIIPALILTLIAGLLNGSFAAPMKYMDKWKEENIWFFFSFWGMLIFPWLTILLISPNSINFISFIPQKYLLMAIVGGLVFGIGQLCFSQALGIIGLGLSFIINISMGTAGTALIPLLWQGLLFSKYGLLQAIGILIFVVAVVIGVRAGVDRDKNKSIADEQDVTIETENSDKSKSNLGKTVIGIVFALIAGVGSICQGVSYALANPSVSEAAVKHGMNPLAASVATWVVVFSAAWLPYVIYFFVLNIKKKTLSNIVSSGTMKEYIYLFVVMALGYWGSVVFFSRASSLIGGALAPTIAWPLFMIFIILAANFWGWVSGEWKNAGSKAITKIWISISLFVVAIIVFSGSAVLKP